VDILDEETDDDALFRFLAKFWPGFSGGGDTIFLAAAVGTGCAATGTYSKPSFLRRARLSRSMAPQACDTAWSNSGRRRDDGTKSFFWVELAAASSWRKWGKPWN
jgi:hypothetical protein